jgi:hypothetical protein
MKKYFIEFVYPGIIVSETSKREIPENEHLHPELVKLPESCFGFRFGERTEVEIEGESLKGAFKATSGWFIHGEKQDLKTVKEKDGEDSTLYRNMESNGYEFVVRTRFGQAIPLSKGDVAI